MIKLVKRSTAIIMVLVMLLVMGTTSFASEGKTVGVKGFIPVFMWGELTEEDLEEYKSYFSVSNVVNELDNMELYEEVVFVYEVEAHSTVTLLADGAVYFGVSKVEVDVEDKSYTITDERRPVNGQVEIWVPDDSGAVDEYGWPLMVEKVIDASELSNYEVDFPHFLQGCTVTLTEPGVYFAEYVMEAAAGSAKAMIIVKDSNTQPIETTEPTQPEETEQSEETTVPATVTANSTSSKVLVNGVEKSFEAYNIDGNNYFKLRDLAAVVNGTEKQFEVEWDNTKKAINLVSNKSYTEQGGEMAVGDGVTKTGTLNTAKIYIDGVEVQLTAYNINGNNYFKLRDIAQAFNIGVTWDNATKTVGIDTSIGYTE